MKMKSRASRQRVRQAFVDNLTNSRSTYFSCMFVAARRITADVVNYTL